MPTILKDRDDDDEGYVEGKVVNTRFGSFPHSTLIGVPWGTQVRASRVDTGSRGRRIKGEEKKRKREESDTAENAKKIKLEVEDEEETVDAEETGTTSTPATAKEDDVRAAPTGFIHLLPPTPENWTSSLPHRTQVVYTPDYSYILHRIRARPGTNLIEAGAGSGSFTHASARAVYSGYPAKHETRASMVNKKKTGKVWSYEFHEQRHEKLQEEIRGHGMEGVVQITHRDVCENGFLVDGQSPGAESIFLDLPAPWLALPHLSRSKLSDDKSDTPFMSPLNPKASVYICTFSPCIEQVQKTVSVMRQLGWVDIEMVEIAARRFEIRRERVGIEAAQRGVLAAPSSVSEAVARLLEVEGTFKTFHENGKAEEKEVKSNPNSKQAIMERLVEKKVYKEGKLAHRTEPEIKTHTSYLVFAILPMEWYAEDEELAAAKWPLQHKEEGVKEEIIGMSRRQQKKAEKQAKREEQKAKETVKGEAGDVKVKVEDAMDTNE